MEHKICWTQNQETEPLIKGLLLAIKIQSSRACLSPSAPRTNSCSRQKNPSSPPREQDFHKRTLSYFLTCYRYQSSILFIKEMQIKRNKSMSPFSIQPIGLGTYEHILITNWLNKYYQEAVLWIRIRIRIGSGFNGIPGSGSRRAKNATQNQRKVNEFHLLKCSMFSFEGSSLLLQLGRSLRRPTDK